MSKNRRIALVFGGFVTAVAAAFYPIFFYPLTHTNEYSYCAGASKSENVLFSSWIISCQSSNDGAVQKVNRTGINQADVQPVGVKIWSDPFKPADK